MLDNTNPLLANIKLPGRIFQLPSKGLFYKNGELDESVRDGEIHIHPMSALDEINMRNPDQLFSGEAVNTVFKRCVSGVNKPAQLLAKDVDAIMLFLRAVTYGAAYEFTAKHTCENAKVHNYVANLDEIIVAMKQVDDESIDDQYSIRLKNGQVVKLVPSKYQNVLDLIKSNESKKQITAQDEQKNLLMLLMGIIESVDGITSKKMIEEWLRVLPSPLTNSIGAKIEPINDWGAKMQWTGACKDCGETFEVDIPINPISFFIE